MRFWCKIESACIYLGIPEAILSCKGIQDNMPYLSVNFERTVLSYTRGGSGPLTASGGSRHTRCPPFLGSNLWLCAELLIRCSLYRSCQNEQINIFNQLRDLNQLILGQSLSSEVHKQNYCLKEYVLSACTRYLWWFSENWPVAICITFLPSQETTVLISALIASERSAVWAKEVKKRGNLR